MTRICSRGRVGSCTGDASLWGQKVLPRLAITGLTAVSDRLHTARWLGFSESMSKGTNMSDQPSEDDLRFLKGMGMIEVEPGRWSSGWQGSDPAMQEWFDGLGGAGEEQLDLLMRAERVQNEFDLEQSGAAAAS
jgi:hypothetical protein